MLSRRTFLTAGAAAPLVWSQSSAFAANEKLTLGFIGVGTMGRGHLGGFLGRAGGRSRRRVRRGQGAARQRDRDRREAVRRRGSSPASTRACKAYTDFRELLAHKDLDAVVIATPDHWHAIPAVLAARAGKHIYCEKPLTQNLADGRWIVNEVAKAKVVFQTGSQQRSEFGGHFRKAVEYVWNGRIGKLKTVRIGVGGAGEAVRPAGRAEARRHRLGHVARAGAGARVQLRAVPEGRSQPLPRVAQLPGVRRRAAGRHGRAPLRHRPVGDEHGHERPGRGDPADDPKSDRGLKFVYASGVVMIHNEFAKDRDGKDIKADCVFEGTEGTILVSRGGISSLPDTILKDPIGEKEKRVYPSTSHHKNWLECIASGKETICPAETGHRSASICHLGNIGYRLNRKLKWDAAKELFTDDAAANKELSPRAAREVEGVKPGGRR